MDLHFYQMLPADSPDASREHQRACAVLKGLQHQIARGGPGCTVSGNRITVRWTDENGKFVQVHAVIIEVDDGDDTDPDEEEDWA